MYVMNTVYFYEGPAGCGKTTRLMAHLDELLLTDPLEESQRVLALTFMHGSRKRLHERLLRIETLGGRFTCSTLDSFAWRLVNRWRSLLTFLQPDSEAFSEEDHEVVCMNASLLLTNEEVQKWVSRSFPIVVVDEAQDLCGHRLAILKAICRYSTALVAADEFQDLSNPSPNEAVAWLRRSSLTLELTTNHRTSRSDLLCAANALRCGKSVEEGASFRIVDAPNHNVAAGIIATAIKFREARSIAILSPSKTPFVDSAVTRVGAGPVGKKKDIGPYHIFCEANDNERCKHLFQMIDSLGAGQARLDQDILQNLDGELELKRLVQWANHKRRLKGAASFSREELKTQVKRIVSNTRQFSTIRHRKLQSLTIHQAKNREFDGVIILWPYQVVGDAERLRKLLYNGVTRARKWVIIVIQDSKGQRRRVVPFSAPALTGGG